MAECVGWIYSCVYPWRWAWFLLVIPTREKEPALIILNTPMPTWFTPGFGAEYCARVELPERAAHDHPGVIDNASQMPDHRLVCLCACGLRRAGSNRTAGRCT